jgi:hypothetical protein
MLAHTTGHPEFQGAVAASAQRVWYCLARTFSSRACGHRAVSTWRPEATKKGGDVEEVEERGRSRRKEGTVALHVRTVNDGQIEVVRVLAAFCNNESVIPRTRKAALNGKWAGLGEASGGACWSLLFDA